MVVQLMYRPLRVYKGVQSYCLELYTLYNVDNMYDKFQGCTVDVQAATMILINPRANPVLCVYA